MVDHAVHDCMPALALTDTHALFGSLEFSEAASYAGIQPIMGLHLALRLELDSNPQNLLRETRKSNDIDVYLTLLAKNAEGYGNLMALSSAAFLDPEISGSPYVTPSLLQTYKEGIIALTGGHSGPLDSAIQFNGPLEAQKRLIELKNLFGSNLYIELQRHGLPGQKEREIALLNLAYEHKVPIVATNHVCFLGADDYEAHDVLQALADGVRFDDPHRRRIITPHHRFKTRSEMVALFSDLPEALENTVEIAYRCAIRPTARKPLLPSFIRRSDSELSLQRGHSQDEGLILENMAYQGLEKRLKDNGIAPGKRWDDYKERLSFELSIITKMQYSGYFLIVADFIQWAKNHDIPVGPGRGSGAGSLVAYALTITDLDPLRFGLLFERFLNPDRVSMPDFDIDFCQDRRDEVIRYVQERYGCECVAQIITFGTLLARGVLRDVGRVLGLPYGQVDQLAKLIPYNPTNPVTLQQAIADEPRLQEAAQQDPSVERTLSIAQKLEGLHRHASIHPAGLVIADRPLVTLVPLYRDPNSHMRVTQYAMKMVEKAGLVKFDFLGLKTLTVLSKTVKFLHKKGLSCDLSTIPLDDPKTYALLNRGETVGVFQLESAGMRKALMDMRPDRFEDLIALVALYRPGPMANIPLYCNRKHGLEPQQYVHPKLEPILSETYGTIVYQEQVMQVAQVISGYSLAEADLLRRAMGKKIRSEMDAQRQRFIEGALARGIPQQKASEIFDLLAKFADYGFNKSHAAAYALLTYQTAYLKANFTPYFLAASMTLDLDNTDKIRLFCHESHHQGIALEKPSINDSGTHFSVSEDGEKPRIHYALAAIKGVGEHAAQALVEARGSHPFKNLEDFAQRIPPKSLNKRTLEALIGAGAFDILEPNRSRVWAATESILSFSTRKIQGEGSGQQDFFQMGIGSSPRLNIPEHEPWSFSMRLQREYASTGLFLSGHPLDSYGCCLETLRAHSWIEFSQAVRHGATAGRLIASVLACTERRTRSGSKIGILDLSDQTSQFEVLVFSELLRQFRSLFMPGQNLVLLLNASLDGDTVQARLNTAESLESVLESQGRRKRFYLNVSKEESLKQIQEHLKEVSASENLKGSRVSLILTQDHSSSSTVEIELPEMYRIPFQTVHSFMHLSGVTQIEWR